ncbi:hypothetical protein J7295_02175 [Nakaseomyces glabratus]|nr:hypothetical protein J7298_02169 [Nakaseomyces glabratus]KAH7600706.1 hypothetical protein J7295_02175 [Nakaseomyces glabratus]KAH7613144.1 hypothetical protein J7292_02151 [Nakaseomyces glabratus]
MMRKWIIQGNLIKHFSRECAEDPLVNSIKLIILRHDYSTNKVGISVKEQVPREQNDENNKRAQFYDESFRFLTGTPMHITNRRLTSDLENISFICKSSPSFISEEEYTRIYRIIQDPGSSEYLVSSSILSISNHKHKLIPLPKLLSMIHILSENGYLNEIHMLFGNCKAHLSILKSDQPEDLYRQFLELMLDVEYKLLNFHSIEKIFSEYIKMPNIKAKYMTYGLRAFIENNDFQLAKAFFFQALTHSDNFPMTPKELHSFLSGISDHNDLTNTLLIFYSWISAKCKQLDDNPNFPLPETMQLIHRMILLFQDRVQLTQFCSNVVVKQSGYLDSVDYKLTVYFDRVRKVLADTGPPNKDRPEIFKGIQQYIDLLDGMTDKRELFFKRLLCICTDSHDLDKFMEIVALIEADKEVDMEIFVKDMVGKIIARKRRFGTALKYYEDLVLNGIEGKKFPIKHEYLSSLWIAIVSDYPTLAEPIKQELFLTLNTDKYKRAYPWLKYFLQEVSQLKEWKLLGGVSWNVLHLRISEYDKLKELDKFIKSADCLEIEHIIQQTLRDGLVPNFHFNYSLIKLLLKGSLVSSAKTIDDTMRKNYYSIPEKLNILWLRNDIDTMKKNMNSLTNREYKRMISSMLDDFVNSRVLSLGFKDYIQLTHLAMDYGLYGMAFKLLKSGKMIFQEKNGTNWKLYYLASLKLHTQTLQLDQFMAVLQSWIKNKDAYVITPGCLRRLKSYSRFFKKNSGNMDNFDADKLKELEQNIQVLKTKYLENKYKGLNDMHQMCQFIKTALDRDAKTITTQNANGST